MNNTNLQFRYKLTGTAVGQRGGRVHGGLEHWAAADYPDQLLGAPAAVGLAERGHAGPRGRRCVEAAV